VLARGGTGLIMSRQLLIARRHQRADPSRLASRTWTGGLCPLRWWAVTKPKLAPPVYAHSSLPVQGSLFLARTSLAVSVPMHADDIRRSGSRRSGRAAGTAAVSGAWVAACRSTHMFAGGN